MNHFKHEFEKGNTLQLLRGLKNVNRLSGKYIIQKYSVAEHCYYTGILFEHFAKEEKIMVTENQIQFVYRHDIMESITGDLLRPAKKQSSTIQKYWDCIEKELAVRYGVEEYLDEYVEYFFPSDVIKLFKTCDILELYLFLSEEKQLGNKTDAVKIIHDKCIGYIYDSKIVSIIKYIGGNINGIK